MEKWKLYAFAAAVFAGLTSVIAKAGLSKIGADVGLAVRTVFVFGFILINTLVFTGAAKTALAVGQAGGRAITLLALSALTTTLSWVFYYRAMAEGSVAYVSLVDKGSILITLILSVWLLGEPLTLRMVLGAALILGGLLVLAWK